MTNDEVLKSIVADNDFISSKRLFDALENDPQILCVKRDFLFRSGAFDGRNVDAAMWSLSGQGRKILVTGHSSYPFRSTFVPLLRSRGFKHFFALNAVASRYVSPIPLGLTSRLSISQDHLVLGNDDLIGEAWSLEPERPNFDASVYVNVTSGTSTETRLRLLEVTKGLGNVIQVEPDKSPEGRLNYLRALRRANFTPAPRGVGSDTHRLWETLYMGGIPVILSDKRIDPLVRELPVLVVRDWTVLADIEFLRDSWKRLGAARHRLELLRASIWTKTILRAAEQH